MTILYIKACGMQVMQYIKGDIWSKRHIKTAGKKKEKLIQNMYLTYELRKIPLSKPERNRISGK